MAQEERQRQGAQENPGSEHREGPDKERLARIEEKSLILTTTKKKYVQISAGQHFSRKA
jgi:hypothetical protein